MNIVIKLGKKYYSTIEEFAKEIYLQHEEALALIKSEKFLKILYNYNQKMYNNIVELMSNPFQQDALLFKTQYILNPIMGLCYHNYYFDNFASLAKQIIAYGPKTDIYLKDFLKYKLLSYYMEITKYDVKNPSLYKNVKKLEEEFLDNENRAYFKLGFLLEGSNIIIYNGKKFENPKKLFEYLIMPVNIIDVAKDFIKSQYVLAWLEIKGFQKEIVLFENLVISIEQKERKNDSIRKI